MEEFNNFVFFLKTKNFLFTEQKLIKLSNSHGIPLSYSVMRVNSKKFKHDTKQYGLKQLRAFQREVSKVNSNTWPILSCISELVSSMND